MSIHPTAIIATGARIDEQVSIGPYCVIGKDVQLGKGVNLHAHVSIEGRTSIGENTEIFSFASLGSKPQDLKYQGEPSELTVGKNNAIREHVTMNTGTKGGGMLTRVGDNCLFMMGSHVAHDCLVGNNVILANNATLGGHVVVGDHAIIGGLAAIHQFVRIGKHAMIGGLSAVEHDVIPYGSVVGDRAGLAGLNLVGLKRRNFDRDTIHALRNAFKMLFDAEQGTLFSRITKVQETYGQFPAVVEILEFIEDKGQRSLCVPKSAVSQAA
jgi:UDP-N-acetylglucosamine acyltransferase